MIKVDATLHTAGDGYWSRKVKTVRIIQLRVLCMSDEYKWGELRVYFNRNDWDVENDGLIYTDGLFEKELKEYLTSIGIDASDVSYSEQGMQGDWYVSLDVGEKFLASWKAKTEITA